MILLLVPVLNGLALLLGVLAGDAVPAFERAAEFAADPVSLLPYAVFMVIFGPLPEELGWRGYALDGLQARWNALWASLILGFFWAVWHVPMFVMVGTYQAELGVLTLPFWEFMFGATVVSVLYTWIYNNTGRSILGAVLFHFSKLQRRTRATRSRWTLLPSSVGAAGRRRGGLGLRAEDTKPTRSCTVIRYRVVPRHRLFGD